MSSKRQRQRKTNERVIPIEIEGDPKKDDKAEPINTKQASPVDNVDLSSRSGSSTDANEDANVSVDLCKLELSDTVETDTTSLPDVNISERMLPPHNVPERIIIVLDRAEDEISSFFEVSNNIKLKPLDMLKGSLKFFLKYKSLMNNKHQFALITLNENSATWTHDFTNNPDNIIRAVDDIEECETEDIFDMNAVFELIIKNVSIPAETTDLIIPPPHIVRTVFLYNRSITMPEIILTAEINNLLTSPYFTFDIAMTHEVPDSSNKCNLIFTELQKLDRKGFAYFFPISRNATLLFTAMAKLLSHPLQRCAQKDSKYTLRCN